MGASLIVDDPELATVLSGTHLPTMEGWKADLVKQREEVGGPGGMTFHRESNPGRSHGSTMVYPLSYSCLKHTNSISLQPAFDCSISLEYTTQHAFTKP